MEIRNLKTSQTLRRVILAVCLLSISTVLMGQNGWTVNGSVISSDPGKFIGIGTSTPTSGYKVHMFGNVKMEGKLFLADSGYLTDLYYEDNSGYGTLVNHMRRWSGQFEWRHQTSAYPNPGEVTRLIARLDSVPSGAKNYFDLFSPVTQGSTVRLNTNGHSYFMGGNLGIGTTTPQYKLAVNGTIGAKEIIVTNSSWPDYVFRPGYKLTTLDEIHAYVQKNQHLPGVPSEAEVEKNGVGINQMQTVLLTKIEELTLHMIELNHKNRQLTEEVQKLQKRLNSAEMTPISGRMIVSTK